MTPELQRVLEQKEGQGYWTSIGPHRLDLLVRGTALVCGWGSYTRRSQAEWKDRAVRAEVLLAMPEDKPPELAEYGVIVVYGTHVNLDRLERALGAEYVMVDPSPVMVYSDFALAVLPHEPLSDLYNLYGTAPADTWIYLDVQFQGQGAPSPARVCELVGLAGHKCIDATAGVTGLFTPSAAWHPGPNTVRVVFNAGERPTTVDELVAAAPFKPYIGDDPERSVKCTFYTSRMMEKMQSLTDAIFLWKGAEQAVVTGVQTAGEGAQTVGHAARGILTAMNALNQGLAQAPSVLPWVIGIGAVGLLGYFGWQLYEGIKERRSYRRF